MIQLNDEDRRVLAKYERPIVHLRERKTSGRLALTLGAGVSVDFGLPHWSELVDRLCSHPMFARAVRIPEDQSLTVRVHALIQHLRDSCSVAHDLPTAAEDSEARHQWISVLHECLYSTVSATDQLRHPYLSSFLDVVKDAPLTINYNFDDTLERMFSQEYAQVQRSENDRLIETVWEPSTQFQRSKGVIYHPNGFLPLHLIDGSSEHLVFSESDFADQLIDAMAGHYAILSSHFSRFTTLLLGLSLRDSTLKHLLRRNVHLNPGHVHYFVRWCRDPLPPELVESERQTNFDVFGLVTLHLSTKETASLGRLLSCNDAAFNEALDRSGDHDKYVYYVTGAVGAGKTSVVKKLKSLDTMAEWIEARNPLLGKPHTELSDEERAEVDNWVSAQFRSKNFRLQKTALLVSDRSPLDPLAFTEPEKLHARAKCHRQALMPEKAKTPLVPGHVILLKASGAELLARAKDRHATADVKYLEDQQSRLEGLLSGDRSHGTITVLSTSGRTLHQVVRQVARVIHLGEYEPMDIDSRLAQLAEAGE